MKFLAALILGTSLLFGVVDINNASKTELTTLNGVGKKKAEAILEYAKTHCFKSIDSLQQVKGIGPKTIEKNRTMIEVGECKK
ncbi:MAG: helix-hairpin-helix domain-containing protein [Sulfurimonas sp.]|nr:helix-hairpin-helix domain-containing protein [Sulfurimonas sp.]MDQ7068739.1 helix-hairpin-helix domain-containing protein [Sulfurimonas sp.]